MGSDNSGRHAYQGSRLLDMMLKLTLHDLVNVRIMFERIEYASDLCRPDRVLCECRTPGCLTVRNLGWRLCFGHVFLASLFRRRSTVDVTAKQSPVGLEDTHSPFKSTHGLSKSHTFSEHNVVRPLSVISESSRRFGGKQVGLKST